MFDAAQKTPTPDFLHDALQGGKSVGERQKEFAARTATPGTVPVALTEALRKEADLKAALAGTEAEVQRGIQLTDQWNSLLHRREKIASHVRRGQELLFIFNDSTSENGALDTAIETGAMPPAIFGALVQLSALPFAREYFAKFIARKQVQLARAQADVEGFAALHKITL